MATNLLNSLNRKAASGPEGLGLTRKKGGPAGDAPAKKGFQFSAMNNTTKLSLIFAVPAVMLAALALPALIQTPEPMNPPGASMEVAGDVEFADGDLAAAFNPDQPGAAQVLPGGTPQGEQPEAPVVNGHGDTPSGESTGGSTAEPARPINNGPRTHTLAEGETLSHVAAKYYGRSSKWRDIAKANGISESEAGRLRPGTKLTIPDLGENGGGGAVARPSNNTGNSGNSGSASSLPSGPFINLGGSPTADASNNQMVPVTEVVKEVVVEEQTHVLQPGDNPFRLARQYYDDLYEQRRIREANPEVDWLRIQPGTKITIPALIREVEKTGYVPAGSVAPPSSGSSNAGSSSGDRTYTVQKGDTLSSISRKMYGSSAHFAAIQTANGMRNPNDLQVGQVLTIPAR